MSLAVSRFRPLLLAVAALAGCLVPPPEEVVGGKGCDEDGGHACAPGYVCCRGACELATNQCPSD
ncbi:MAG TPA: hypothetical protein VFB81_13255 [Myxococcales bacterium]|nr:hypothetical protein [Myxococcales bacterium]